MIAKNREGARPLLPVLNPPLVRSLLNNMTEHDLIVTFNDHYINIAEKSSGEKRRSFVSGNIFFQMMT